MGARRSTGWFTVAMAELCRATPLQKNEYVEPDAAVFKNARLISLTFR
jgi:hypothetical protein